MLRRIFIAFGILLCAPLLFGVAIILSGALILGISNMVFGVNIRIYNDMDRIVILQEHCFDYTGHRCSGYIDVQRLEPGQAKINRMWPGGAQVKYRAVDVYGGVIGCLILAFPPKGTSNVLVKISESVEC